MKTKYIWIFLGSISWAFGQQKISFEASEGFTLGTIHNQNNWEVTEGQNGFIQNQVISNEKASEGTYAFKNAYEKEFGSQWMPILGATKTFDSPMDYSNFTLSYDVYVTEKQKSDFELMLFSINANDEYVPVAGVGIENRGYIYLTKDVNYGFEYANTNWTPNTWINVKIEVTQEAVKYYINNVLEYTVSNFTLLNIHGFYMLHNNYGGDAYYDNILLNTKTLSTDEHLKPAITLYPNPTKGKIKIEGLEINPFSSVEIFDSNGKKISESNVKNLSLEGYPNEGYWIRILSKNGTSLTKKIIKQ